MLIVTRLPGQSINIRLNDPMLLNAAKGTPLEQVLNQMIRVVIVERNDRRIRVGIDAPSEFLILREELEYLPALHARSQPTPDDVMPVAVGSVGCAHKR